MTKPDRSPATSEIPDLVAAPAPTPTTPISKGQTGILAAGTPANELDVDPPLEDELNIGGLDLDLGLSETGDLDDLDDFAPGSSVGGFRSEELSALSGREEEAPLIWPKGQTIHPDDIQLEPELIAQEADYPEPAGHVLVAVYSLQVLLRRRALKSGVPKLLERLKNAESARDTLVRRMVQQQRQYMQKNDRLRNLLEPVEAAERTAQGDDQALASAGEAAEQARSHAKQALSQLESARDAERAKATETAERVAECERASKRLQARIERLLIELRNIEQTASLQGPQSQQRVSKIDAEYATLQQELAPVTAELERARGEHGIQLKALQTAEAGLVRNHKRQARRQRDLEKRLEQQRQSLAQANAELESAVLEAGREILALRHDLPIEREVLNSIRAADERADRAQIALLLRVRALDAYAATPYRNGWLVIAALLVMVVGLIIAL